MLLLFDIDGTLLNTSGSGMAALHAAAKAHFGEHFTIEGVSFAGRLDPLIISEMLRLNGQADSLEHHALLRAAYRERLGPMLARPNAAKALGGVHELLAALRPRAEAGHATLGLLTGNYPETGAMKLRHCGIDPDWFTVAAWGDDAAGSPPKREDLVPFAIDQLARKGGPRYTGESVTVIGDTPHDVRCAKAHGGRCLAVATGHYSVNQLLEAGADLAVPTLTDTNELVEWLLADVNGPSRPSRQN